jgi:predicted polyphosphate/ATP-dependent NAD kinase
MVSPRVGLVVNPVAGMGGRVGLKGTDGPALLAEAVRRGAVPQAQDRARDAVAVLLAAVPGLEVLAPPGALGAEAARAAGAEPSTVPVETAVSGPEATRAAVAALQRSGIDLLLFAGGDGTARDVASVLGEAQPALGIPTGVKMQSGVFATSPRAAGRLAADWLGGSRRTRLAEVADLDEEGAGAGRLGPRLFGHLRVPDDAGALQHRKLSRQRDDDALLAAAGAEIAAQLAPGTLCVIGPGTAPKTVLAALGLPATLLGVDLVRDRRLVAADVGEEAILAAAGDGPVHLVLGATGGQGFVLGRGNQPIGPRVVARAGRDGITILAGRGKLALLPSRRLLVDSGDPSLDAALAGHVRVVTGPGETAVMRLDPA